MIKIVYKCNKCGGTECTLEHGYSTKHGMGIMVDCTGCGTFELVAVEGVIQNFAEVAKAAEPQCEHRGNVAAMFTPDPGEQRRYCTDCDSLLVYKPDLNAYGGWKLVAVIPNPNVTKGTGEADRVNRELLAEDIRREKGQ